MFLGDPLGTPVGTQAAVLAGAALNRRLTIYAGAGLSAGIPTSLPGAKSLAKLLVDRLAPIVDFDGVDPSDLLAVADHTAAISGGDRVLHDALQAVAAFDSARTGYGHAVLGLLICEGSTVVIEANYDNCIERSVVPEQMPVVVSDQDRIGNSPFALLKAHGCITRPSTMLVTTADLTAPPLYARAELAARLSSGDVAFVGLGSPADYVISSLQDFVSRVDASTLTVVDPQISNWEGSGWEDILPSLPANHRVAASANEFCDEVLRYYVLSLFVKLRTIVGGLAADHPQRVGLESVLSAIFERSSVWVLKWLRGMAFRPRVGSPAITSTTVMQAVLGLSSLAGALETSISPGAFISFQEANPGVTIMLLTTDEAQTGSAMALEAQRRVMDARSEDRVPRNVDVLVLCCGQLGPLGADELRTDGGHRLLDLLDSRPQRSAPTNIMGEPDPHNIIDGIGAGNVYVLAGDRLVEVA
ncbi:MAG: hypothetical protein JWP85_594 [Rhodoglobus sp.]|nr:hypothetical protein [Rhodoglobus sp.]